MNILFAGYPWNRTRSIRHARPTLSVSLHAWTRTLSLMVVRREESTIGQHYVGIVWWHNHSEKQWHWAAVTSHGIVMSRHTKNPTSIDNLCKTYWQLQYTFAWVMRWRPTVHPTNTHPHPDPTLFFSVRAAGPSLALTYQLEHETKVPIILFRIVLPTNEYIWTVPVQAHFIIRPCKTMSEYG